jgi:hypothetical protein
MKSIKIFLNYIKSKYQKLKIWLFSNTANNFKYSKGDRFILSDISSPGRIKFDIGERVVISDIIYGKEFTGRVVDINARYRLHDIRESWKVDYYVIFFAPPQEIYNLPKQKMWIDELDLKKWSLEEERNWKINSLLNED